MSMIRDFLCGRAREDKERSRIEGERADSIRYARIYVNELERSMAFLAELEMLLAGPEVAYNKASCTKAVIPAGWHSPKSSLVILFSIDESPVPISAWIEGLQNENI